MAIVEHGLSEQEVSDQWLKGRGQEHVRTRHLPEWSPPEAWPLSFDEVGIVVNLVFRSRCAISGLRPQDPSRPQFCLCPLDKKEVWKVGANHYNAVTGQYDPKVGPCRC